MINSDFLINGIIKKKYFTWSGVPCSLLGDFITYTSKSATLNYISASNEGESIAINSGLFLGNTKGISILQNSGLGNAVNPLTSLVRANGIHAPLIMSMRGNHLGFIDEPQHEVMGKISETVLKNIGYDCFTLNGSSNDILEFSTFLDKLEDLSSLPALLVHRNSIKNQKKIISSSTDFSNSENIQINNLDNAQKSQSLFSYNREMTRADLIETLCENISINDIVVSTTGFTSRELAAISDRDRNFYMVGAMGCASAVALGIAIAQPSQRVYVLDGDGAALMRLGTLATIANVAPKNLTHILLNNAQHESTGGQNLSSRKELSFHNLALTLGYPVTKVAVSRNDFKNFIQEKIDRLQFVEAILKPGTLKNLPRPQIGPIEVTKRFKESLIESTKK